MTPPVLGLVLGLANAFVCAALYAFCGNDPRAAGFVFAYGMLPAVVCGILLGLLAGGLGRCTPLLRCVALVSLGWLGVVMLGAFFRETGFIAVACVPTALGCLILERYSRKPALDLSSLASTGDEMPPPAPTSAVRLSMMLGAAAVFIVMAGVLDDQNSGHMHWLLGGYMPFGFVVGLALGAPFGAIADWTRDQPAWARQLTLSCLAVELTFILGNMSQADRFIGLACIPVIAGCLVLERYSRATPRVTQARARA